jgi:carbon monoxide dehydrogenase subunit G
VAHFDFTIDISRPPDEVFAFLTDVERLPEWQSSAVSATVDGDLRVGAVIGEQRRFMGRDLATTDEVTAYERPTRFEVKSRGGPVAYEIRHVLAAADGGTRLRIEVDVKVSTVMRIAAQPALKAAERELKDDFKRLKEMVETGAAVRDREP